MNAPSFRVLHGLIRQLPLPLVLFGNRQAGVANERFDEVFLPGQLDHPDLRRLARDPTGVWQPVRLRRRDGRDVDVYAQAVVVADGVLLSFDASPGSLLHREKRLRDRIAELERASGTDPLTGARNRAQLECMVDRESRRALRSGEPATMILLDIDHFKRVNDTCGHLVGDAVLVEFVDRIRQRIRDTDQLFRWGGDEFVVLATSVARGGGGVLAEDLRRTIGSLPFRIAGAITASLGVAEFAVGESGEAWLGRTDQALYAAKRAGRNRIHVDRRASSDREARRVAGEALPLLWLAAYECGEPTIDAEHRELFALGNALITAANARQPTARSWRNARDAVLGHLTEHFRNEEAVMARHDYARLAEHRRAHARLLEQAGELMAAVEMGTAIPERLARFLVDDVIALHLLRADLDFRPSLRIEDSHRGVRVRASSAAPAKSLH